MRTRLQTFTEAEMGATHGAPRHSTNYRIHHFSGNKMQGIGATAERTGTNESTQSAGAKASQSSHCNLATQSSVLYARRHIDFLNVTYLSSCNPSNVSIVPKY